MFGENEEHAVEALLAWEASAQAGFLTSVACSLNTSSTVQNLKLDGFSQQPGLAAGVAALLPPGLTTLCLAHSCSGPLPELIGQRCRQLQSFSIIGNAAAADWAARGAAPLIPLLRELCLDHSSPQFEPVDGGTIKRSFAPDGPSARAARALQAATQLSSLDLAVAYSDTAGELIASLPAVRALRLTLLNGRDSLPAAVAALRRASGLTGLHLSATTSSYPEGPEMRRKTTGSWMWGTRRSCRPWRVCSRS
ncbi:hypothetical protein ABPG75_004863 [Micractinium tetrahymenae]